MATNGTVQNSPNPNRMSTASVSLPPSKSTRRHHCTTTTRTNHYHSHPDNHRCLRNSRTQRRRRRALELSVEQICRRIERDICQECVATSSPFSQILSRNAFRGDSAKQPGGKGWEE
ncbi:hypothetical protein CJF30_00006133 [Rutstroemia sp. NJR-2017a BBW]|nr:hypothetical protein CJF30_00006133 [Rutstroemia sp. NJR-2017a BBW]